MDASSLPKCRAAAACGYVVGEELGQSWSASVVATSLVVAVAGAFTSTTITSHLRHCRDRGWFLIFTVAAGLSLGVNTVWCMHFVGMHALQLAGGKISGATQPLQIDFELLVTALSALGAWLAASCGIYVMSDRGAGRRPREVLWRLAAATLLIGSCEVVVHYVGMVSQVGSFAVDYDPLSILASVAITSIVSAVGLLILMVFPGSFYSRLWGPVIISCAASSMHYAGMAAATYRVSGLDVGHRSIVAIDGRRVALGVMMSDLVLYAVCHHYGEQQRRALEHEGGQDYVAHEQRMRRKIAEAVASLDELGHPIITVPANVFLDLCVRDISGKHEGLRPTGQLKYLDTKLDADTAKEAGAFFIYFSYESVPWSRVGPNADQLAAMKSATRELAGRHEKQLHDVYIWLDCLSTPQRNLRVRTAAINSIYTLTAQLDAMVIVCPDSFLVDTQTAANEETIKGRLWCRLEHVAYCCSRGTRSMYLHRGRGLEALPPAWMESVCCVFEAESTCCRRRHWCAEKCDREILVQPMLALFYDVMVRHRLGSCLAQDAYAYDLVQRSKERMFPATFVYKTPADEKGELRDLFGEMIGMIEVAVNTRENVLEFLMVRFSRQHSVFNSPCL